MTINMCRQQLSNLNVCEHAGLLIDRGFKVDRGEKLHNDDKMELCAKAATISENTSPFYSKFYENWQQQLFANEETAQVWHGKLINRMYLGMGEASPLEAGITLHHTYGVPYIPGPAIKGVLHHYARDKLGLDKKTELDILFGEEASAINKEHSGSAGYIIFNDAWWVPEGKALVAETITVHSTKYYNKKGKKFIHPDFESPNPNPQIAIQGSFLFSIEGEPEWAEYAMKLLQQTLHTIGIGGKNASGYGYFEKEKTEEDKLDEEAKEHLNTLLEQVKSDHNIPNDSQAFISKPMAEEWNKLEDENHKQKILIILKKKWEELDRIPSKKAQKIYDQA